MKIDFIVTNSQILKSWTSEEYEAILTCDHLWSIW
jgi:hypothetical protein